MELKINTANPYKVVIETDILSTIGARIDGLTSETKVCIITDENVHGLYTKVLEDSFLRLGIKPYKVVFPANEYVKSFSDLTKLINFLSDEGFGKSDMLIALGGGVIGDLTGFAASIYLRGIKLYQIPTSLLAAVDSSVGGKNALNLRSGKNLVGTVYQPLGVFFDPKVIETLPSKEVLSGIAEMVKAAIINDPDLFDLIERAGKAQLGNYIDECVARALIVKRDFVESDPLDKGERRKLNLGHTVGHAIEKLSHYHISHGLAVAKGLKIVCDISVALGYMEASERDRILNLLESFGIRLDCKFTADEIYEMALHDKKIDSGILAIVLPYKIGDVRIEKITLAKFREYLEMVL